MTDPRLVAIIVMFGSISLMASVGLLVVMLS